MQLPDPNLVLSWGAVLAAAATWLIHKARGEKTASARDILDSIVTQVINTADVDLENVKLRADQAIRSKLAELGIKGAAAELMVHEFVEYASAQLHERFDRWTRAMDKLDAAVQTVPKAFETPPIVAGEIAGV